MQPLLPSSLEPLKTYYYEARDDLVVSGKATIFSFGYGIQKLPGPATPINAGSGFLSAGICPFDANVVRDNEFFFRGLLLRI